MGCCVSTNSKKAPASASAFGSKKQVGSDKASSNLKGFRHESRAPPPPSSVEEEEEAVKEVLSEETHKPKPIPIPQPEPIFPAELKNDLLEEEEEKETKISAHKNEAFPKIQQNQNMSGNEEIISEASEICSVSVSESVSTMTTVTEKRNNEEEEEEQEVTKRQRVISSMSQVKPPPPPRNGFKRDRAVNQSPTRKSDRSPNKRISNGSMRLVQKNPESGRFRGPVRSEPGESSGRRSRSPAITRTTSAAMGRNPSLRRTNKSPDRVRPGPTENINGSSLGGSSRKMEAKLATNNNNETENCSTNESLENPLVSLECFIFL